MANKFGNHNGFWRKATRRSSLGSGDAINMWLNNFDHFYYLQLQVCCSHRIQTTGTAIEKETVVVT